MTTCPPTLSDPQLAELGVRALDAALSSASVDTIGVSRWWERATSALEAAGSAGDTWPGVCSTLAAKLQIEVFSEPSARELAEIGAQLDEQLLGRWCYLAERDAPYLVAMCRLRRVDRAARKKPPPAATTPAPAADPPPADSSATDALTAAQEEIPF